MTDTIIDFMRHGEPVGGRRFRGHGIDDPLSEKGWAQMRAAVEGAPAWTHIISSPLQRCQQFSEELAGKLGVSVSVDDRFKEVGFGCWEGRRPDDIQQHDGEAYAAFYRDPVSHRPEGAEPWDQFLDRVSTAFSEVATRYSSQQVLVVAHAGVIRAAAAMVLEVSPLGAYRIVIDNAGLTRFRYDGNKYRLEYLNRRCLSGG